MVAVKQFLLAVFVCFLLISFGMDQTSAHPMGMFGGGHHGGGDIGALLAAGIVASLLQHHG